MKEYLKNNICKFTPLFDIDYSIKQNIISVSLFKIKKGYKDFNLYVSGLIELNEKVKNDLQGFRIRLFIDKNIYEDSIIFNKIKQLDMVDVVLFHCNNLINNEGFHDGLFGTLVRFFPMFEFENNDAGIVNSVDADVRSTQVYVIRKFQKFVKNMSQADLNQIYFYFHSRIFSKYAIKNSKNNIATYTLASRLINIKKFEPKILTDFINNVKNSKNIKYTFYSNSKKSINFQTNFIFGVDEYFINKTLINYMFDNKMCYATRYSFQLFSPLFFAFDEKKLNEKMIKTINSVLKFVLKKHPSIKDKSLNEKKDFLESKLYRFDLINKIPEFNEQFYDLNYRLYIAYAILRKHKHFDIVGKQLSDFMLLENFGYISIESINFTNCSFTKSIIIDSTKFPDKYLQKISEKFKKYNIK